MLNTTLVGRTAEIARIGATLGRSKLVTVTGPAGCGKTRLAVEAASTLLGSFGDDVQFVDLSTVSDPDLVPNAVAGALDVPDLRDQDLAVTLADALRRRAVLVVLDNCEHVADAARSLVAMLLERCPRLRVLATGREPLRIAGEVIEQIAPLGTVPLPTGQGLPEAVQLFIDRARLVDSTFAPGPADNAVLVRICQKVDGIPLAIEWAAARLRVRSLEEIATGLDDSLSFLTESVPGAGEHQRTLLGAMEWSFRLLSPSHQDLLVCLSAFAGAFTEEVARRLCEAVLGTHGFLDQLTVLVDASLVLVIRSDKAPTRYRLLETVRTFGRREQVERGISSTVSRAHARLLLSEAEKYEPLLTSKGRIAIWPLLREQEDDFRLALEWSLGPEGEREVGLRIGGALFWYWNLRGSLTEGRRWEERLLAGTETWGRTEERGKALYAAGGFAFLQGDYSIARRRLEDSSDIWRTLDEPRRLGFTLVILAMVKICQGELPAAQAHAEEALRTFQELGDRWGEALASNDLGNVTLAQGDLAMSRRLFNESIAMWEELDEPWGLALSLGRLAAVARMEGDHRTGTALSERAQRIRRRSGDTWGEAESLRDLGDSARLQGHNRRAADYYYDSLRLNLELGRTQMVADCVFGLALVLAAMGRAADAGNLCGVADALRAAIRPRRPEAQAQPQEDECEIDRAVPQGDRAVFDQARARSATLPLAKALAEAARVTAERSELPTTQTEGPRD